LVTFANVIEQYTRLKVVKDLDALYSQYDEDAGEHPARKQVTMMAEYGELV
jgi:hypothetical protein